MPDLPEKFFGLAGGISNRELFILPYQRQSQGEIDQTPIYLETITPKKGPREVYIPYFFPVTPDLHVSASILTRITTGLTEEDGVRLSDISDDPFGPQYVYAAELPRLPTRAAIWSRGLRYSTLAQTLELTANNNGGMNPERQAKTHAALTRLRTHISGQ